MLETSRLSHYYGHRLAWYGTILVAILALFMTHASADYLNQSPAYTALTTQPQGPRHENAFHLDSSLGDIQWASSSVLFVLSFDGRVYRSRNGGRSWEDQQANMRNAGHRIRQIRISPEHKTHVFFVGEHGRHIASTNMGESYYEVTAPVVDIRLHPTNPVALLGAVMTPACGRPAHPFDDIHGGPNKARVTTECFKQLYMSRDFGKTWTHLQDYVVQYDWAPSYVLNKHRLDSTIYATVHADQSGNQSFGRWNVNVNFVVSHDSFKSEPTVLVPHGNRFLFGKNGFVFVAAVDPEDEVSVKLMVAKDLRKLTPASFSAAMLPVSLSEHSYTILNANENSVFLHVNHKPFSDNAYAGHIYVSDSTGTQYSLSLPFNHRNSMGKCDFTSLDGIEGIFLANFVDEIEMTERSHVQDDVDEAERHENIYGRGGSRSTSSLRVKTVITYNKGAEWSYLDAPDVDADGNPYKCKREGNCHLHLHGVTHGFGPFYSVPSARGLIMATGMVGSFLHSVPGLINTYFSEDGGLTWREVAKGSHIYEFGDHGGLIVMASDQSPTNTLYYSWDHARTWTPYVFSDSEMMVENIITEPSSTSPHFLIYGTSAGEHSSGVGMVVFVDFMQLHPRKCVGIDAPGVDNSDYELWSPHDGRTGGKCLMGHTVTYVRRKPTAQCTNPKAMEKPTFVSNCACTIHDFECDIGYMREAPDGPCVPDASADTIAQLSVAQKCASQTSYRMSKGYRKVPGNSCVGGHEWEGIIVPCPSGWLSSSSSSSSFFIILILVALLAVFVAKSERAEGYLRVIKDKLKLSNGYMQVGAPGVRPSSLYDEDTLPAETNGQGSIDLTLDSDSEAPVISTAHIAKGNVAPVRAYAAPPALQPPPGQ